MDLGPSELNDEKGQHAKCFTQENGSKAKWGLWFWREGTYIRPWSLYGEFLGRTCLPGLGAPLGGVRELNARMWEEGIPPFPSAFKVISHRCPLTLPQFLLSSWKVIQNKYETGPPWWYSGQESSSQFRGPGGSIDRAMDIHIMEYYSAWKRKEFCNLQKHGWTWRTLC